MSTRKGSVDLTRCEVLDTHCHGFRAIDPNPDGWEDRLTYMGTCFGSSGQTDLAWQIRWLRATIRPSSR